ncbi:MAG: hypothetical protein AAGF12_28585 [Myxococcota bacterium]
MHEAGRLEVPAIVVGLGPFGARVVERIVTERDEALRGEDDPVPLSHFTVARNLASDTIAGKVLETAREVFAHRRMVQARDTTLGEGLSRLHVFLIGNLGEEELREKLQPILEAVEARLLRELGPIFEPFRTGSERNLVLLPLLAMPHPPTHAEGKELIGKVRDLCRSIAERPPRKRATPQVFLIEDVAEFSVLSDAELEQCLRNFLTLLLYSLSAIDQVSALLYGQEPDEPLATFVCAVAELPRARLERYAVNRVALELVESVLDDTGDDTKLSDLDALEEVEFAAFDEPKDADRDVLELLNRYGPPIDRDDLPPWWERSETTRARYGPDPQDPSINDPQPPPEPPVGWALQRMRDIEQSWRLLQRRRFDDVIAQEREDIQKKRDALLSRIRLRVDRSLFAEPSPDAFRRTGALVRQMERAVSLRLEDAIRDRDRALPVPPPDFDAFKNAHASFLDEVRRKPDLARVLLYGFLAVLMCVLFGPIILRTVADALLVHETDWQSPVLRDYGWLTCLLVGLLGNGTLLGFVYRARVIAIRQAFHVMWDALENTVTGLRDSVLEYFASRLRLSRQVARVEALLAVRSSILSDAERLTLLDRAVRRARGHLLNDQQSLGVVRDEQSRDDLAGMLSRKGEALVESLVPPDARRFIDRMIPIESRDSRIRDVLHSMARDQRYQERWREEVPFTSIDALRRAAFPHAEVVAHWDPFEDPESAEATAEQIASFARRQARSLHVALNVSGHEIRDTTGTTSALSGDVIVPPRAFEEVRRHLTEGGGAAGRAKIPAHRGVERDRAFYVLTLGDIHEDAVASLTQPGTVAAPEDDG